jgi:hypothetical protein
MGPEMNLQQQLIPLFSACDDLINILNSAWCLQINVYVVG